MPIQTDQGCACCGELLRHRFDRRRFLQVAGSAALIATTPFGALAAYGDYEAMLLSCIDPRFPEHTLSYARGRGLAGKYSQFVIAGAAIGVVAPAFQEWHKAFWDNLAASIQLHRIKSVIAINHRECGAAKIAYGEGRVANAEAETQVHREALAAFRREVAARQPALKVETGLMALDGRMEMFTG